MNYISLLIILGALQGITGAVPVWCIVMAFVLFGVEFVLRFAGYKLVRKKKEDD